MIRQCGYRAIALAFLLCLGAGTAQAQCAVNQSTPAFTAGGSVFGRTAPQWNQYSAVKVDANNGTVCNLTILGTLNLAYSQIVAALGYVPTPTGVITGGTDTSITSASTTDLGGASNPQSNVTVTGTASITSFGTSTPTGQLKVVTFSSTPTLVYNATSMILPGAANIVVAAKAIGVFKALGSGNWAMVSYSGFPVTNYYVIITALSGTVSAPTTYYRPSTIGDGTLSLPASPVDADTYTIVYGATQGNYTLTVAGNGHNVIVGGTSDTAAVMALPGSLTVQYSSSLTNWQQK